MINLYKLYDWFDTFAHNCFRKRFSKKYSERQLMEAKRNYPNWQSLTKSQKREIAEYWGLEHPVESDFITHEIMMNVKGEYDVRYVPEKVFRLYIDPAMGNRKLVWAWDDKNYFDRFQPSVPFPYTYVRNANGYFLDHDYNPISQEETKRIINENLPLIIKPSLISGEGKNIRMISDENQVDKIFSNYDKDYMLQELIIPCDKLKMMSPHSVCCIRLVTAIVNGEPKLLRKQLLCNTTDSIAVNAAATPGTGTVLIGIDDEGALSDTGYYENAKKLQSMPWNLKFGGLQIPSFNEAVNFALKAHKSMPMFGFIGWDVTIDEHNRPVFFEWNLGGIEIYHSQLTQGPLFGEYSDYFAAKAKEITKRMS